MKLNLDQLLLLGLLSVSIHWLIARSLSMRWFWSRMRGSLAKLLSCAACSGLWLGLLLGAIGVAPVEPFFAGRPTDLGYLIARTTAAGLLAVFLTPVLEGVLIWGLAMSAIEPDDRPDGRDGSKEPDDPNVTP